ncbi:PREDICTED: uncharacterized protein YqbB-like [Gekko japonicus]|uniref:Uncharacterized protein YqbB-like n=1 Tax=Gekko japonicus TaxID=146911 RepID=A0ABM1LDH7_GEKJA|nr:PREDICTED: uncharacterized protein YqbB-like [Gekko japonicus]
MGINKLNKPVKVKPSTPKLALKLMYQRRLFKLIDEMQNSVMYWLMATYKQRLPDIVEDIKTPLFKRIYRYVTDASPSREIEKRFKQVMRRWTKKFNEMSDKLANDFVQRANTSTTASFMQNLKKKGFVVQLDNSYATNNVLQALILENTRLIKSIPQKYFLEVQGILMRGIANGRDAGLITKELSERYGIVKRRAAMISRDQTNKAVETISRERSKSLGITKGVWIHRGGSKHPRESHISMDGTIYTLAEGCYDYAVQRNVQAGELINCNCTYSPYIE